MILFWTRKLQIKKKNPKSKQQQKNKANQTNKKTQAFIHNIIKI